MADLYKTVVTIPVAFQAVAAEAYPLKRAIRLACRDRFREHRFLEQLAADVPLALGVKTEEAAVLFAADVDPGVPGYLWDPARVGGVEGGVNHDTADEDPYGDD